MRARTPFLGRARELATLEAALAQVESGRGQVVGIVGEPGIGKSRLLAEWRASWSRTRSPTWKDTVGRTAAPRPTCQSSTCCARSVGSRLATVPRSSERKSGGRCRRWPWPQTTGRRLSCTCWGMKARVEGLADVSAETLKAKTFEALQQLCLRCSQQHPLILAVEDLQWIDPTSEAFLARLVDRIAGAPILVLVTYRPGYRPPWQEKSYATQLSIPAARHSRTVCMWSGRCSQRRPSRTPGTGDPRQGARQSLLPGGDRPDAGGTGRRRHEERDSPPTHDTAPARRIQGVLAARIDRLPADEKGLLQTLAVIGHRCWRRLLLEIVAQPEAEVAQRLGHLQRLEFLYELPAAPEPTVTFKHILTQEVAYHSLSPARQRVLHERTAQAIEGLVGERLAEHYGELAHHYSRSSNTEKAVAFLQRAGQQAADRSAYREAITHLARGLERLPSLPESPECSRQELDFRSPSATR